MSEFSCEYAARTDGYYPTTPEEYVILIGIPKGIPDNLISATEDKTTCLVRICESLNTAILSEEIHIGEIWQEVCKLVGNGPYNYPHAFMKTTKEKRITWVGNAKLFSSIHELIVGVSRYVTGDCFGLVDPENFTYTVNLTDFHPYSWRTVIQEKLFDDYLASIYLELFWYVREGHRVGIDEKKIDIRKNRYSIYSTHLRSVVLLISYYNITMNTHGSVQDHYDMFSDYRAMILKYAKDQTQAIIRSFNAVDDKDCVAKICNLINL